MIYFTSDSHFWHNNVIKYCNRPYETVEQMNEDMVKKWNNVIKPDDEVYHLGDFSLAFRSVEIYSNRLIGKKYLIPGNHDVLHNYNKKSRIKENRDKWIKSYEQHGWEVLPEQITVDFEGLGSVNLCHHPYASEYELKNGDKYAKWRPIDDGKLLLNGHCHEKWKTSRSPKGTLMINVGVDVHGFYPVSLDKIIEIVKDNSVT